MDIVGTEADKLLNEIQQYIREHPYGYQDENGIDLSLIRANLQLTPDERVKQAQKAAQQLARMLDVRNT
jgi:hypothetical protein